MEIFNSSFTHLMKKSLQLLNYFQLEGEDVGVTKDKCSIGWDMNALITPTSDGTGLDF